MIVCERPGHDVLLEPRGPAMSRVEDRTVSCGMRSARGGPWDGEGEEMASPALPVKGTS